MLSNDDFIKGLTQELNPDINKSDSAVFQTFLPFVENQAALKQAISNGNLRYEYIRFIKVFKGSSYEAGLACLISLFRALYPVYPKQSLDILTNSFWEINRGLKNATQIALLQEPNLDLSRLDLFAKYAFRNIGDIIEGTLKPFLHFFFDLITMAHQGSTHKASLGTYTQKLIAHDSMFEQFLKAEFYGIEISQWRNIANHNSYHILCENEVEVSYGKATVTKQVITREQLEDIFRRLDNILYWLKTAHVLISIDHLYELLDSASVNGSIKDSGLLTEDDITAQIVETSTIYGYSTLSCKKQGGVWSIEVKESIPKPLVISTLTDFVKKVVQFAAPNASIDIYDYFNVRIFHVALKNRQLHITKLR